MQMYLPTRFKHLSAARWPSTASLATAAPGGACTLQPCCMLLSAQLPMQIFQTFFCRMNEPSYIKHTKLEILAALADQSNAYDIVTELTEYVNDIDEKLARKAIQAVGQIALSVSSLRSCL